MDHDREGGAYHKKLRLVMTCVDGAFVCARVGEQLAAVNAKGCEGERAVSRSLECSMLELHYALRTLGLSCYDSSQLGPSIQHGEKVGRTIGDCPVVGFLEMPIIRE